MKFRQVIAVFVGALAIASVASADTVVLKNGDHLTGTVEVSDGKDVTLKTDFAGEIKIQWSAVLELKTDKPIYVVTPDKKTVSGTVSTDGSNLVVHTANNGTVQVPLDAGNRCPLLRLRNRLREEPPSRPARSMERRREPRLRDRPRQ